MRLVPKDPSIKNISVEGQQFVADDSGVFNIPDALAARAIRDIGMTVAPAAPVKTPAQQPSPQKAADPPLAEKPAAPPPPSPAATTGDQAPAQQPAKPQ